MGKLGRRARYNIALDDGREIGYSLKVRGGYFRVQFPHPTENKHLEAATGVAVPKGWSKQKAPPTGLSSEADRVIKAAYSNTETEKPKSQASWEEATTYLLEGFRRKASRRTYRSALSMVKQGLDKFAGPGPVTKEDAERYTRAYSAGHFKRAKGDSGALRPRAAQTVVSHLKNLSVLWVRMKRYGLVSENVWAEIDRPRVPKKLPRIPSDESFEKLLTWLDKEYPGEDGEGWELIKTFVGVKMISGCRLDDLCCAESVQLDPKAKTLLISSDHEKTYRERNIELGDELSEKLNRLKGTRYLWERYVVDSATFRPGPRRATVFTPSVMYNAIASIFADYNQANPEHKVKTHDLRKRAITFAVKMTGSVDAAALIIPITPQTARANYIDPNQAYDIVEAKKKMVEGLLLKPKVDVS